MNIRLSLSLPILLLAASCAPLPPPVIPPPFSDADNRLLDHLKAPLKPALFDVENATFEKALSDIARNNDLNIAVNWEALTKAGVEKTTPVAFRLHNVSVGDALSAILSQIDAPGPLDAPLAFHPNAGVLNISTMSDFNNNFTWHCIRRQYDVRDLILPPAVTGTNDPNRRISYLIDLITTHIAPRQWHIVQYPDVLHPDARPDNLPLASTSITDDSTISETAISAFGTSLIITQTPENQAEIADMLNKLRGK